ncbi:unnamed protein product [Cuscuta europaea]|uniref:DUF4283 domain-containing protein n=1 Tax=Cuscuta europaea TaxID=41803 RepID=A0A9P0ZBJ0_CUSEU|nr:unnamed protein product [Cuscuta europaea]
MARTKQNGAGGSSIVTRSSPRFVVLDTLEGDFPELGAVTKPGLSPARKPATNSQVVKGVVPVIAHEVQATGIVEKSTLVAAGKTAGLSAGTTAAIATRQIVPGQNSGNGKKPGNPAAGVPDTCPSPEVNFPQLVATFDTPGTASPAAELPGKSPAAITGPVTSTRLINGKATAVKHLKLAETSTIIPPWNSLFKDNCDPKIGIKLKYVPPKGEIVDFGDRVLPSMVEMWGHCLVGHFTGKFPGLKAVHDLKASWGVKCFVRSHNKGWIIFKFQDGEDRSKVLHGGPYTVFGKLLMLKELSEDFTFEDEEFLKIPIWIKFPKLPMCLWNDEAMSEVASRVGVPITTDKITQERANNDFARVLIEVDLTKPPPLHFPIRLPSRKVIKQSVVYETFPNFCFHCKEFGHHPFICKKLAIQEDGENEASILVDSRPVATAQGCPTKLPPGPTGSLIVAKVPESPAARPTGCCTDPIGYTEQFSSQGSAKDDMAAVAIPSAKGVAAPTQEVIKQPAATLDRNATPAPTLETKTAQEELPAAFEEAGAAVLVPTHVHPAAAFLEARGRTVRNESDLKQDDVVIICEIINGKTLKLIVKPFKYVHASVIRVDTSFRLTDDLDKKGLTFTTHCLERLPGVTKKRGEVCFDSKFTTPFRTFFGG